MASAGEGGITMRRVWALAAALRALVLSARRAASGAWRAAACQLVALLLGGAYAACSVLAATASSGPAAGPTSGPAMGPDELIVKEAFTPDKLGAATNLSISARFASSEDVPPAPITRFTFYGPAGLRIDANGAGTCTVQTLRVLGPPGCPADSRVGFGGGVAVVALPKQILREPFTLDFFFGPREQGRFTLLAYASAHQPVSAELVVVGREIQGRKPYGIGFSIAVPQVSTIQGLSNASVESAYGTFGASAVTYVKIIHGHRRLVHVRGLVVPQKCPRGGFPTQGTVQFADGVTLTTSPRISCPRR